MTNVRVENPAAARFPLPEAAPEIVFGYWREPIDGISTTVLVFEADECSEEAAKYPVPPTPGVTQLDLTVREAFAHV